MKMRAFLAMTFWTVKTFIEARLCVGRNYKILIFEVNKPMTERIPDFSSTTVDPAANIFASSALSMNLANFG